MKNEIAGFLEAIGETEYALEVESMHNRLEAFSDGLDKKAIDCAIKAAEEAIAQRDELLVALNDVVTRIKDHPAYEELTEDEEINIGGDTAELSYLARICDSAISCVEQSAESETQSSLTRIDETQTSIPAIVFYPAGSLGEAVEEWGSHGA